MFNPALKEKFINRYKDSISISKSYSYIFDYAEKYEEEFGCDLCQMTKEQAQQVVDNYGSGRSSTTENLLLVLRLYSKWCKNENVENVTDSFEHIISADISLFREKMVGSPLELKNYMDTLFDCKAEDKRIDNIYRCFFWLGFMGIDEDKAVQLTPSDIDLGDMVVLYNGSRIDIYKEAYPVFRNVVRMDSFTYSHSNYTEGPRPRPRVPGNLILRGFKGDVSAKGLKKYVVDQQAKRINKGIELKKLTYSRIWLSGIMYRAYEQERAGIIPDFSDVINDRLPPHTPNYKQRRSMLLREYRQDYARWKLAFVVI